MSEGWICLHRKLRDNPIYTNSTAVHVWIECLLRAAHEGKDFYCKREKVRLEPGQFLMGRDEFGQTIGVSPSTVWFWIQRFEVDSMVDIKRTVKGSVITIKKWNRYQELDRKVDNGKTTDEQRMNTNNNVNNENNKEKSIEKKGFSSLKDLTQDVAEEVAQKYRVPLPFVLNEIDSMTNWCQAKGRTYRNYKAALQDWVKRDAMKLVKEQRDGSNKRAIDATGL